MNIPPQVKKWIPWVCVPVGYVILFCIFAYGAFPYDRLKQRIVVGYNNSQQGSPKPKRMEIGDVTWAWRFPGIVLTDVSLIGPKPTPSKDDEEAVRSVIEIEEIYARVAPLSFLFGTTNVSFAIDGFGGTISGTFEQSETQTRIQAELSDVDPGQLPGVAETLQMPLSGSLSGSVDVLLPEGKISAADAELDLEIEDTKLADGKTKIRGMLPLPEVDAGLVTLRATVNQGRVDFEQFEVNGTDLEAKVEGKLRLRDRLELSSTEQLTLRFKFSDAYRDKDDNTRSLLGKPNDKLPGLIDSLPQTKQAKQEDGSYRWRVLGTFARLNFTPFKGGAPAAKGARGGTQPTAGRNKAPSAAKP